jgi:hypothetical protein
MYFSYIPEGRWPVLQSIENLLIRTLGKESSSLIGFIPFLLHRIEVV